MNSMKGLLFIFLVCAYSLSVGNTFMIIRRSSTLYRTRDSGPDSGWLLRDSPDHFTIPSFLCSSDGRDCERLGGMKIASQSNCRCVCNKKSANNILFKSTFTFSNGNWKCTNNSFVRKDCSYFFEQKENREQQLSTLPLNVSNQFDLDAQYIYIYNQYHRRNNVCRILARTSKYINCNGLWVPLNKSLVESEFNFDSENDQLKFKPIVSKSLVGRIVKLAMQCDGISWRPSQCVVLKMKGQLNCSSPSPSTASSATSVKPTTSLISTPRVTSQAALIASPPSTSTGLTSSQGTTSATSGTRSPTGSTSPASVHSKTSSIYVPMVKATPTQALSISTSVPYLKSTTTGLTSRAAMTETTPLLTTTEQRKSSLISQQPTTTLPNMTLVQRYDRDDDKPSSHQTIVLAGSLGGVASFVGVIVVVVVLILVRRKKKRRQENNRTSAYNAKSRPNTGDWDQSITIRNPQATDDMVLRATQRTGHNPVTNGSAGQDRNEGPVYGVLDGPRNHVYGVLKRPYSEGNSMNEGLERLAPIYDDATEPSMYEVLVKTPECSVVEELDIDGDHLYGVLEGPDSGETPLYGVLEEPDSQETPVYGVLEGPDSQETPLYGVLEGPDSQETPLYGVLEEPDSQETPVYGVLEGPDSQEIPLYGVLEGPDSQETPSYGVLEGPDSQEIPGVLEGPDSSEETPVYGVLEGPYSEKDDSEYRIIRAPYTAGVPNDATGERDQDNSVYNATGGQIPISRPNDSDIYQELEELNCNDEYQALSFKDEESYEAIWK